VPAPHPESAVITGRPLGTPLHWFIPPCSARRVMQSGGIAKHVIPADMELDDVSFDLFEGLAVLAQEHPHRSRDDQLAYLLVDSHGPKGGFDPCGFLCAGWPGLLIGLRAGRSAARPTQPTPPSSNLAT